MPIAGIQNNPDFSWLIDSGQYSIDPATGQLMSRDTRQMGDYGAESGSAPSAYGTKLDNGNAGLYKQLPDGQWSLVDTGIKWSDGDPSFISKIVDMIPEAAFYTMAAIAAGSVLSAASAVEAGSVADLYGTGATGATGAWEGATSLADLTDVGNVADLYGPGDLATNAIPPAYPPGLEYPDVLPPETGTPLPPGSPPTVPPDLEYPDVLPPETGTPVTPENTLYPPTTLPDAGTDGPWSTPDTPSTWTPIGDPSSIFKSINGSGVLDLLKTFLPAAVGVYGANEQAKNLRELADRQFAVGQPSRDRYEGSYAPGFTMASDPGYQDMLDQGSNSILRSLNAKTGGVQPSVIASAMDWTNKNLAYPALQSYRTLNANTGGLAAINNAAPGSDLSATKASTDWLQPIGAAVANYLDPSRSTGFRYDPSTGTFTYNV